MNAAERARLIRERFLALRGPKFVRPRAEAKPRQEAAPEPRGRRYDPFEIHAWGGRKVKAPKDKRTGWHPTLTIKRVARVSALGAMTPKLLARREYLPRVLTRMLPCACDARDKTHLYPRRS